jgi:hypothetical protein
MEANAQTPVDQNYDDEIDLRELFTVLWAGKIQILVCVLLSALVSVSVALYLPNKYTAEAVLAPRSSGGGGGLAQLASQYGGLASLAGINIGGIGDGNPAAVATEMLKTREFFSEYLYDSVLVDLMAAQGWNSDTDAVVIDDTLFDAQSQTWVREVAPPYQKKPSAQEAHGGFRKWVFKRQRGQANGICDGCRYTSITFGCKRLGRSSDQGDKRSSSCQRRA